LTIRLLFLAAFWCLVFASCKEVSFREPQPLGVKPLTEVPEVLRGMYIPRGTTPDDTDTLIIESWGYHFKDSNDKDWLGRGTISDSLVLKFYKDYYFVNFRLGDQWVLRLIKQNKDGSFEFLSILQNEATVSSDLKKLSKKIKYKEIKRGDDVFYQINPTTSQLMQLIDEGFFTGNTTLDRRKK
jgi:hypothetical protein